MNNILKILLFGGIALVAYSFLSSGPSVEAHKKWIKNWYPQASDIVVYDIRNDGNGKYSTYISFDMNKLSTGCSTTILAIDLGKNLYDLEEKFNSCKSKPSDALLMCINRIPNFPKKFEDATNKQLDIASCCAKKLSGADLSNMNKILQSCR